MIHMQTIPTGPKKILCCQLDVCGNAIKNDEM